MVMSTVNLPTNILASDFDDGVEISVEDENEDAPEVVVGGEESSDEEDVKETLKSDDNVSETVNKNIQIDENNETELFSDGEDNLTVDVLENVGQTSSEWVWPTYNHTLKSDWPNYSDGDYHGGTDFPVPLNTEVYSSCDGEVVSVKYLTTSYGKHIKIKAKVNGDVVYIRYCHLNSINVNEGDLVSAGQLIGLSGSTGNSSGPHLHYEVRNSSDQYNPSLNPRLYLPGTSYSYEKNESQPVSNSPFGWLDTVTAEEGRIIVSGWAADMDEPNQPIEVHVYAVQNGERVGLGTTTANIERPDICNNYPGINAYHGFRATFITNLSGDVGVEVYGINVGSTGGNSMLDGAPMTVSVPKDTTPPSIANIEIVDLSASGYTVTCDVSDNVAISKVQFPTWTENGGQDDLIWHQGTVSGNKASCRIEVLDHNNETNCEYITHIYADDLAGNSAFGSIGVYPENEPPVISNVDITDLSTSGFTVNCDVTDNTGISKVQFATWTENGGQDDLIWHRGTVTGNKASCRINVSDHNNETDCVYIVHIYADDISGNSGGYPTSVYVDATGPVISDVEITDITEKGYTVKCSVEDDHSGINRVQFPTWFEDQNPYVSDGSWKTDPAVGGTLEDGKYIYRVNTSDFDDQIGLYNTHIYAWDNCGNQSENHPVQVTIKEAHNHEYVSSIKKEPTCTETGIKLYICKDGDDSYEEEIPATGHRNTELREKKEASCTEEGYTGDTYCKDCGTKLESGSVIAKTEHKWDEGKITQNPTCVENGEKTYTCTSCQKTKKESIAKTGHIEVKDAAIAATCESEGKTEGSHCSVCGTVIREQESIAATGHTWDNGKVTKEATCTEEGEKTYACTSCQKVRTESIAQTGHTEVKDVAVAATCESEGKTEGSHCSVCGTVITEQESIAATGHTWDNGKVTKEATCTKAGEKTYTCTTCQKIRTESIAKTGHTEVKDAAIAATCESEGKTEGSHCSICNTVIKKQEIIPATGHTWDNGTISKETTCTENGEKIYTCITCQKTKTEVLTSTGHSKITKFVKNATCETEGYTGDIYCNNCGEMLREGKIIEKLSHDWKQTGTKKVTCTVKGEKIYTCNRCKKTKIEQIPATGHKWSSWKTVSDATVLQKEKQKRTCSECGTSQSREYGNKLKSVMKVNYSGLLLKTKQSTSILTVSGMAKGDYVSKVQSGNNGIVKVTKYTKDGKIQLTAQGKTGSTKVTIRLAGGAVKQINVKVQKGTVKTTSVKVSPSKVTLKKGAKKTISVTISPATSKEKVTYTSSNKNIATVSTKGVITAKKQGTAKITVKSGSKKQIITVTVK